jgi:hypothetical protein
LAQLGEEFFFPTIEVAVDNYFRVSPAQTETAQLRPGISAEIEETSQDKRDD